MARIFNEKNMSFQLRESPIPEFAWHTSPKLAEIVKSKHLHFDLRSLDPSKYSYPYHFHRNAEEIFVILSGKVTLRTPEEFVELSEGILYFLKWGLWVRINFIITPQNRVDFSISVPISDWTSVNIPIQGK